VSAVQAPEGGVDVLVVGPGAMGRLHAALLSRAGLSVALLDHRKKRARQLRESGFLVGIEDDWHKVEIPCGSAAEEFHPAKLVIIFTKAGATAAGMEHALPACDDDTTVLTLQNGLGNWERIAEFVPAETVLAGTTSTGATLWAEIDRVRLEGMGTIRLGSPTGDRERAERTVEVFEGAGLPCEVTDDLEGALWTKAVINAAINPLTALTGRLNGELLQDEGFRRTLALVAEEAAAVARACGATLPDEIVPVVEGVCRQTAGNRSSMLQDLSAPRLTEIDFINGEIARRGAEVGVPTPLCIALTALIQDIERKTWGT